MKRKLILLLCIFLLAFPAMLAQSQSNCRDGDDDQDGICNRDDACPNDRSNRCANDTDGDSVPDSQDRCPNERGITTNAGCPPPDSDGDGTENSQDRCPEQGGPSWNAGCPENQSITPESPNDSDGDGTPDAEDQCPNHAGLTVHQGCLPPLPQEGDCVAATNSNLRGNIRRYPYLDAEIVAQLASSEIVPILQKIETPDSPFYLTETGWISGVILRFGGDCDEVENPETTPPCEENDTSCRAEATPEPQAESTPEPQINECGDVVSGLVIARGNLVQSFRGGETASFAPYDPSFTGGVNVAMGDVNGDGIADIITGAGPGGGPHVKVFDGASGAELRSFMAYAEGFRGGVNVAAGDVNGDGRADVITGAGAGGNGHVRVFSGADGAGLLSFFAYDSGFLGGVRVAAGDLNGDGRAEIISSPDSAAGPHVKVFDGATGAVVQSFYAFSPAFTGGVSVATGDLNGDCVPEIIAGAGPGGGPHVKVFDGATGAVVQSFFAYDMNFTGGVNVALGDVNGDGLLDIITSAPTTAGNHVKGFDGRSLEILSSFLS